MAERTKICIDRHLPNKVREYHATRVIPRSGGRTRAIAPIGKKWMNGTTPRVRFMNGTPAKQAKAHEEASWWTAVRTLNLQFGDAHDAEIRISFDSSDGAWSYIGTDCRGIPLKDV